VTILRTQMGLRALALALALGACGETGKDDGSAGGGEDAGPVDDGDEWDDKLEERVVDYNAALRIAALRLTGDLPTLEQIKQVQTAGDESEQAAAYRDLLEVYMADVRFPRQMFLFWRDTLKMGDAPELDSAAAFAAQLTVEERPYTDLLTATSGTCPTFDEATGTFTPADCQNGVPAHAGLLTHPGAMQHFFSSLAFRRVRWVQEVFDCTAYPVEIGEPQDVGGASLYNGVWPFESVGSPATGGLVDFQDAKSVVCANCHQTMNHMAPLFAYFDAAGQYQTAISVTVPADGTPAARMEDWLAPGETTAWRYGVEAADLPALGAAMAADPTVAECGVARAWNWAMGKSDIVDTLTVIPSDVIAAQVDAFKAGGFNYKALLLDVFTSDDFVRF
jgi:hypothetical protein